MTFFSLFFNILEIPHPVGRKFLVSPGTNLVQWISVVYRTLYTRLMLYIVDYTRYYMSYIYSINCPRVLFLSLYETLIMYIPSMVLLYRSLNGSVIPLCCYFTPSMVILSLYVAISPPQWFYYPSMLLFNPLNGSIILLCCYFSPSMVLLSLYVAFSSPQWFYYPSM